MFSRTIIFSTFFFFLVFQTSSFAMHLGVVGQTYPVVEPDALAEIRDAAAKVDWVAAMDPIKMKEKIKNFRPENLHSLPVAVADRVFLVDMTYQLDSDIPDGKGGILYPKGYSFNPLDYLSLSSSMVVLDADDLRQVRWFETSSFANDFRTKLLLSGGDYYELSKELGRPVFYLMDNVARRMQLAAVPSIIQQKGKVLEVREVLVQDD